MWVELVWLETIDQSRPVRNVRRYWDGSGIAHALDLIGNRWTALILRELMFGPRRFMQLRSDLPGISSMSLAGRLGELEERGLVRKSLLAPPTSVQVYEATEWGLEAAPVLRAFGRWAARSPLSREGLFMSAVSLMMWMQVMFDPERARHFAGRLGFSFKQGTFTAEIADGSIEVLRGDTCGVDALFIGEPTQLANILRRGGSIDGITVEGDRQLAERFVTFFPLPARAPPADMPWSKTHRPAAAPGHKRSSD